MEQKITYDSTFGILTVGDHGLDSYKVEIIVSDFNKLINLFDRLDIDDSKIIVDK